MFKSRSEGNVVYKCTVRLLEDLDVLECEFQVMIGGVLDRKYGRKSSLSRLKDLGTQRVKQVLMVGFSFPWCYLTMHWDGMVLEWNGACKVNSGWRLSFRGLLSSFDA